MRVRASAGRWRSSWRVRGAKLAISDIDTDGLARTEQQIRELGADVKADRLDVTEREAVLAYADAVATHFGTVNQIYNNAGIAFLGDVEVSGFKDIERVFDVDFWGVVNGTKAFLPHLIASGNGHVVNISSMFGLFGVQGQAPYNAAKFGVRGFTEALRQEMKLAGHPVKVTCVHPGYIKTDIARNASTAEGVDKTPAIDDIRQDRDHQPAARGEDHLASGRQKQGQGVARSGRQAVRSDRAGDRFGLHATVRADEQLAVTADALTSRSKARSVRKVAKMRGVSCADAHVPSCAWAHAQIGLVAQRVFVDERTRDQTRVGAVLQLCAHIGQRCGVQHSGHLVERQHLRLVELVAPVQRHQVLGPDQ